MPDISDRAFAELLALESLALGGGAPDMFAHFGASRGFSKATNDLRIEDPMAAFAHRTL